MTKEHSPRGSIIYKFLILVLAVALVGSLLYPDRLWKAEEANQKECRANMEHILYAQSVYLTETNTFNDTLSKVVDFIKNDTTGERLRSYLRADSILTLDIMEYFETDSAAAAIIDTLEKFGKRYNIDTVEILIIDSLKTKESWAQKIDSMAYYSLDNFYTCPTVGDTYHVEVIDTSVFKVLNIYCPIDSLDSVNVAQDFKLSKIGGLEISNHGAILNWEKSWE